MKRRGVFTAGGVVAGVATALSATMLMQGCPLFGGAGGGGASVNIDSAAGSATAGNPVVTVTATPGATVNEGDLLQLDCDADVAVTIDLIGTASGGSGALTMSWVQTGGPNATLTDNANGTASVATSAAGTYTFAFNATDGTNSASQSVTVDAGAIGVDNVSWTLVASSCSTIGVRFTEEDDASTNFLTNIPGTFTARCTIQTSNGGTGQGDINLTVTDDPAVGAVTNTPTSIAARRSNVVGSAGNIGLVSNITGATSGQTWTSTSSPAGAGTVTIANASLAATTFAVGPPMVAGDYVFDVAATNGCETVTAQVTMEVLDAPIFQLLGTDIARRSVDSTTASIVINVEGNNSVDTTYRIYAKSLATSAATNQAVLGTVTIPATGGVLQSMAVTLDLSSLAAGAGMHPLGFDAIDSVGLVNNPPAALAKAALNEPIAARTQAVIIRGRAKTDTTLAAVSPGVAAAPNEPVGITLATEVGMPVSVGTANAIQTFAAGVVQYPGIGDTANSRTIAHTAGTMVLGNDMNSDGLTDYCFANGGNLNIVFGAVDTLTNGGAVAGAGGAAGAAANANAAGNQDWRQAVVFTTNVGSLQAVTNGGLVDIAVGDFNNDSFNDFTFIGNGPGATGNGGFVFLAGNSSELDPFTNSVELTFESLGAGSETGGQCAAGDFDGDGITDAGWGLPGDDTGAADQGKVVAAYGNAITGTTLNSGFVAGGAGVTIAATFAGTANGFTYSGQGAGDLAGGALILANVTGATSADLCFEQRLLNAGAGTGFIAVVGGANNSDQPDTNIATVSMGDLTAGDFIGVDLCAGILTGAAVADLVVSAAGLDTGTANHGAVMVIPSAALATNANIQAIAGTFVINNNRTLAGEGNLGVACGIIDCNEDGVLDLVVSHNNATNNTVYVANGPLSGTGLNFNDTQNGFTQRLEAVTPVTQIEGGDINGDGLTDLGLFGANTGVVFSGLE